MKELYAVWDATGAESELITGTKEEMEKLYEHLSTEMTDTLSAIKLMKVIRSSEIILDPEFRHIWHTWKRIDADYAPKAYTADEIEGMEGCAIYFVEIGGFDVKRWDIIIEVGHNNLVYTVRGEVLSLDNYGKTWLAYSEKV